jgi:hypothetical protein
VEKPVPPPVERSASDTPLPKGADDRPRGAGSRDAAKASKPPVGGAQEDAHAPGGEHPAAEEPAAPAAAPSPRPPDEAAGPPHRLRTAPREIDVAARLADPIARLEIAKTPLVAFVDLISQLSTIPITIDAAALTQAGVKLDATVSVKLSRGTVQKALEQGLAGVELGYFVADGQLLVAPRTALSDQMDATRLVVADLTGGDAAKLAELASLVRRLVSPRSWKGDGGRGTIEPAGDDLVLTHIPRVRQEVLAALAKLRAARAQGLLVGGGDPSLLATRYARARPALDRAVSLQYAVPTPLGKIARRLAAETQTTILVDWRALAAEGFGDGAATTLAAAGKSLEEAVVLLVEPLDLAWRVIDERTFQITSRAALESALELEVHPVGDLVASSAAAESFVAGLARQLDIDRFREAGGAATLLYDPPSRSLFMLHNQNAQIQLERLLAAAREQVKKKP